MVVGRRLVLGVVTVSAGIYGEPVHGTNRTTTNMGRRRSNATAYGTGQGASSPEPGVHAGVAGEQRNGMEETAGGSEIVGSNGTVRSSCIAAA